MQKCKFKIEELNFECPLEAEQNEEYCYWHQEVDEKRPTESQLTELKNYKS